MAIGIIAATVVLLALDRINLSSPLYVAAAKVVAKAIPFSIGASVANSLLKPTGIGRRGGSKTQQSQEGEISATLHEIGATIVGAVLIALSVAPTEEVLLLAFAMDPLHQAALVLISLITTYGIVFEASFSNVEKRRQEKGFFQSLFSETTLSYVIALILSAVLLLLFHRIDLNESWSSVYSQVVVLGFPAAIGGAAGRLVS